MDIEYISKINAIRCDKWHSDGAKWIGPDWSNALAGEVGEACNVIKKIRRLDTGAIGRASETDRRELVEKLALELADVYLHLDLLARYFSIDLPDAIVEKFNKTSEEYGFPERLTRDYI